MGMVKCPVIGHPSRFAMVIFYIGNRKSLSSLDCYRNFERHTQTLDFDRVVGIPW